MGSSIAALGCVAVLGFVVLMVLLSAIKIVPEYERGVIFRLGRLMGARGPGVFFVVPIMERMVRIDTRVITMDVPAQEVITLDNVTIKVNAVLYFMVVNPNWAVTKVMDYIRATMQIAQTTLRSVVGQVELDEMLAQREKINQKLQLIIDEQTEPWGVKGDDRGDQGRGAAAEHAARDGEAGRGRARKARQDHPRLGRVRGLQAAR